MAIPHAVMTQPSFCMTHTPSTPVMKDMKQSTAHHKVSNTTKVIDMFWPTWGESSHLLMRWWILVKRGAHTGEVGIYVRHKGEVATRSFRWCVK